MPEIEWERWGWDGGGGGGVGGGISARHCYDHK